MKTVTAESPETISNVPELWCFQSFFKSEGVSQNCTEWCSGKWP